MTIQDLKITSEDYVSKDIAGLPDRPSEAGMSAQALKERFDASTKHIVQPKFNQLIEMLTSQEGADNIGITPIEGVAGYTVQQILTAVKILLDDKQSIEQSNKDVEKKFDKTEAQALVKSINFTKGTGVFTITKYDGTEETIDTPIEKIPLDVRLDGQEFVLTLDDGTEQRVDISKFLTETEVKNSDTITLAIESGVIVARLASGSVKLSHLNAEVTAYIDAKELAAYQSAQAAAVSEQNALNSANAAKASEQAAKQYQEQACACATNAKTSETNAAKSENNASASERNAAKSEAEAKEAAEQAKSIAGGDFLERPVYDTQGKKRDIFNYVDEQIALITQTGIPKLTIDVLPVVATTDNQTVFEIVHDTFDILTDTVAVQSGMLKLSPNRDYTIEGNTVVLTNGVPAGRTLDIWIFKNVPMGDDGSVSGKVIADGTLPLSALEKMPEVTVTSDIPLHLSINENGGLRITYDDGSDE